jgi:hypothetical protein
MCWKVALRAAGGGPSLYFLYAPPANLYTFLMRFVDTI